MLKQVLFLAVAGAFGAVSRYALCQVIHRFTGTEFPYGTLIVNVIGCLVIGFIIQLALNPEVISPDLRIIITIGFLGAFTTFSAFSNETARLLSDGSFFHAAVNIVSNVGLGLLATFAGILLGKLTIGGI